MASAQQQQGHTEYRVRLADASSKKYHVMRFKPPHKCDLEKLVNPTLDRQVKHVQEGKEEIPESGEGSEYGRKWREEARKRKRGYASRKEDPDEMPWVLKEKKRGGAHFIGRKEGTVNTSSSYFILSVGQDGAFEAFPVKNWYDFVPPVKYNYLNSDEAEERFERRNKTLNYFSIMLSKKMKDAEEEGGDSKGRGEEREAAGSSSVSKKWKKKQAGGDTGLLLTDSSSGLSSDDSENEGTEKKKDESWKKKKKKRKASQEIESEAGEETDEGEVESREVDYMSESTSDSEHEFQAKQALKEAPKDDEEVERQEEGDIDKGFTESSSSEDEELTEEGKEIKALLTMHSGTKDTNSDIEGEEEQEDDSSVKPSSSQGGKPSSRSTTPTSAVEGKGTPKKKHSSSHHKSSKHGLKREREHEKRTGTGAPLDSSVGASSSGTPTPDKSGVAEDKGGASQPPSKKQKTEFSPSSITEEEVKRYLLRRPITSKDLVRKFTSKKTEMDRHRIVDTLGRIIHNLKDAVDKQTIKGKMYLSLKKQVE